MKAMILCAGRGSRMGSLTKDCPKPMLSLQGKPLLEYTIRRLRAAGIYDVVINLSYQGTKVIDYFGDGRQHGVSIKYSLEPEVLGTAGGVKNAVKYLGDRPFLLLYGDNYYAIDFLNIIRAGARQSGGSMFSQSYKHPVFCILGVMPTDSPNPSSSVVMHTITRQLLYFKEKPDYECRPGYTFGGMMVLHPQMLESVPEDTFADFGHDVIPQWVRFNKPVHCYTYSKGIYDIGTPARYTRANVLAKDDLKGEQTDVHAGDGPQDCWFYEGG